MVGLKAESQAVLDQLMEKEGANLEATGHIMESTEIEVVAQQDCASRHGLRIKDSTWPTPNTKIDNFCNS